jgi:pyruvate dehydrogenase E1 component
MELATLSTSSDTDEDWDAERREWLASVDAVLRDHGPERTAALLQAVRDHALHNGAALDAEALNTPYINTIAPDEQPTYPGDLEVEWRLENILRWNALAMVSRANDEAPGIGGHIATYASTATLYEVALHHFIRRRTNEYGGDLVFWQAAAAPGLYARALLEGRLSVEQVRNYRRERQPEGGLPSYPHPRNMPEFWQAPSASMGLAAVSAIYQARFARYLEHRGLKPDNGGTVWAFLGDGETDEPEVTGTLDIAAREQLDNLIFVVNCNLQRLDGPVRGNGKIVQELERRFVGAGWNVIKVLWGSGWDPLLARDESGALVDRMENIVDGDYQRHATLSGAELREEWTQGTPELERLFRPLADAEIENLERGGHDRKKIYAAFEQAMQTTGRPTVILAKTVKGYGLGEAAQGRNSVHQKKKLTEDERVETAEHLGIPLSEEEARNADLYVPPADSPEVRYLRERREALGGPFPVRDPDCPPLEAPSPELLAEFRTGTGDRAVSTTMALARMLATLLKDEEIGPYVVPIIPDEARTFGMDGLFSTAGIYASQGQQYRPVDAEMLAYYKEESDGQLLQEGINEAGAMASFLAAGTAHATHDRPMIPFFMFYSIFGFPRVGDLIWSAGDMQCKGFLVGGTSGRTTLNGEGVQHQDGHSQVVADTIPNLKSYDPAFAYELAVLLRDGIERMYERGEDLFYYLTVANQIYPMPAMPEGVDEGIVRGLYRFRTAAETDATVPADAPKAHLFGSGAIMTEVLAAQALLAEHGVSADAWSATSYNELYRDALGADRQNRLHPTADPEVPYVARVLEGEEGVFVAASDYMKGWAHRIAPWIPGPYTVLGTDGYGLSEDRPDLRDHFEVSAPHVALAALHQLAREGAVAYETVADFTADHGIDPDKPNPRP